MAIENKKEEKTEQNLISVLNGDLLRVKGVLNRFIQGNLNGALNNGFYVSRDEMDESIETLNTTILMLSEMNEMDFQGNTSTITGSKIKKAKNKLISLRYESMKDKALSMADTLRRVEQEIHLAAQCAEKCPDKYKEGELLSNLCKIMCASEGYHISDEMLENN